VVMGMKVELLRYTADPERLIAAAAKSCASKRTTTELLERLSDEKVSEIVRDVVDMGHLSVIEHAYFTFSIDGISRVTTHQLVRHRIASYSQQSQRYVTLDEENFVIPPTIEKKEKAKNLYLEFVRKAKEAYEKLLEMGIPPEDARYVVPQGITTHITVTMNARELLHFFRLRCCYKSQWEIRKLAWKMLKIVREIAPVLFHNAGPSCLSNGRCPEKKFPCPVKKLLERGKKSREEIEDFLENTP